MYTSFSNQKQGAYAYDHRFDAIARLIRVFIPRFWRKIRQLLCAVNSMLHNPFLASQKEIERATQTIQEQNGHHLLYCNTTTNTRQNKLCNSKNKMEQIARYLLHNTKHT